MSRNNQLPVSEVFYSIQGEGPTSGHPAVFLRLGGCNLMCGGQGTQFDMQLHNGATWRCDTIEVWMKSIARPVEEIFDAETINQLASGTRLIITGGEPLLHSSGIEMLLLYFGLIGIDPNIEIETNGTIIPSVNLLQRCEFRVSPKLSNSGNDKAVRFNENAIRALGTGRTIFKFVISEYNDIHEIEEDYLELINASDVWLMPAGETKDELTRTKPIVAELCKEYGFKYTSRLQIEIWNKKTGV